MDISSTKAEETFYTGERQVLINTIEQLREKIRSLESERFERLSSYNAKTDFDKDFYLYQTYI
jgi:hypothetical protein